MNHKVSYILVWSNTKTKHRNDPSCYDVNEKVTKALFNIGFELTHPYERSISSGYRYWKQDYYFSGL